MNTGRPVGIGDTPLQIRGDGVSAEFFARSVNFLTDNVVRAHLSMTTATPQPRILTY